MDGTVVVLLKCVAIAKENSIQADHSIKNSILHEVKRRAKNKSL